MKTIDWESVEVVVDPEVELIKDVSDIESLAAISTKTTIQRKPAKSVPKELGQKLVLNTARAGHLTVFMNELIVFSIYGLSRQATTTLHYLLEHYNTSQSSDRYNYLGEKSSEGRKPRISLPKSMLKYEDAIKPYIERRWEDYQNVLNELKNHIADKMRKSGNPKYVPEKIDKLAKKAATQYARIVFPAASTSSMIFALNIIELARLYIITQRVDFGEEVRTLVDKMYKLVEPNIPNIKSIVENELRMIKSFKIAEDDVPSDVESYKKWFDGLVENVIVNPMEERDLIDRLEQACIASYGRKLSIEELKDEIAKFYATSFGLQNVSPVLRCLENVRITFAEEMTQYEFEQSVRHRKVRHFTNLFMAALSDEPDYVVPKLVGSVDESKRILERAMKEAWELKKELLSKGARLSDILALLPRGIKYRVIKTSDLKNYLHESALRLCMNAQQEINYHKYLEAKKLRELYPSLKDIFAPRCAYRYRIGVRPFCPEMSENGIGRWCGYPMWNWDEMFEELGKREF